jgi:hypothetical protein
MNEQTKGITKRDALDCVDGLGAIEASEKLAGMLSNAEPQDEKGIREAMLSIDRDLETWRGLSEREQIEKDWDDFQMQFADRLKWTLEQKVFLKLVFLDARKRDLSASETSSNVVCEKTKI